MPDNQLFDAEKLSIVDYKLVKGQIDTPEDFNAESIVRHELAHSLQLAFSLEKKLVKTDIIIDFKTESKGKNVEEASGSFHLPFIFSVENPGELAIPQKKEVLDLNPALANALSSITYSTV